MSCVVFVGFQPSAYPRSARAREFEPYDRFYSRIPALVRLFHRYRWEWDAQRSQRRSGEGRKTEQSLCLLEEKAWGSLLYRAPPCFHQVAINDNRIHHHEKWLSSKHSPDRFLSIYAPRWHRSTSPLSRGPTPKMSALYRIEACTGPLLVATPFNDIPAMKGKVLLTIIDVHVGPEVLASANHSRLSSPQTDIDQSRYLLRLGVRDAALH